MSFWRDCQKAFVGYPIVVVVIFLLLIGCPNRRNLPPPVTQDMEFLIKFDVTGSAYNPPFAIDEKIDGAIRINFRNSSPCQQSTVVTTAAPSDPTALRCFGWVAARVSVVMRWPSTGELGDQLVRSFCRPMLQAGSCLWICGQRKRVVHKSTGTATTTQRRSSISWRRTQ